MRRTQLLLDIKLVEQLRAQLVACRIILKDVVLTRRSS